MTINRMIDHTLLKTDATKEQIKTLIDEAIAYDFCSVCVQPTWVSYASELLKNQNVLVCTVIGFPQGASTPEVKAFETENAIQNGANEIDMVVNIGAIKSQDWELVEKDIASVVSVSKKYHVVSKVIIEACLLTTEEKMKVCAIAKQCGADFVKTSTGFSTGGAVIEDVKLMKQTVGEAMEVKASGGVRTKEDALLFIQAGATRLGTSNGVAIVSNRLADKEY